MSDDYTHGDNFDYSEFFVEDASQSMSNDAEMLEAFANNGRYIVELEQRIKELESGLNEAMDWNWLDDDMSEEVAIRLHALLNKGE